MVVDSKNEFWLLRRLARVVAEKNQILEINIHIKADPEHIRIRTSGGLYPVDLFHHNAPPGLKISVQHVMK